MKHFIFFKKFLSLILFLSLVIGNMPAGSLGRSFLAPPSCIVTDILHENKLIFHQVRYGTDGIKRFIECNRRRIYIGFVEYVKGKEIFEPFSLYLIVSQLKAWQTDGLIPDTVAIMPLYDNMIHFEWPGHNRSVSRLAEYLAKTLNDILFGEYNAEEVMYYSDEMEFPEEPVVLEVMRFVRMILKKDEKERKGIGRHRCQMHILLLMDILRNIGLEADIAALHFGFCVPAWHGLHFVAKMRDLIYADPSPDEIEIDRKRGPVIRKAHWGQTSTYDK